MNTNDIILEHYEEIGRSLMDKHKLFKWKFSYSKRIKNVLGLCNYSKKEIILNQVFSRNASPDEVIDIILHEIAHALAGYKNQHNHIWKNIFQKIGGTGNVLYSFKTNYVPWNYTAVCCDVTFGRYIKPKKDLYCSHCSKKLLFKKSK